MIRLGRGLLAPRRFEPGQPILEFPGPVLDHAGVLESGDDPGHARPIGPGRFLDMVSHGRYIEHSCDPNAGLVNDRVLIALRPIVRGEEVRLDYSTTMSKDYWTMECRCGQPSCRRVILDFHHLPVITQNRYLQLGIVPRFIVDQVRRRSPGRRVIRRTRVVRQVSF